MIYVEVTFTVAPADQNIAVQALLDEAPDMQALPGNLGSKVLTDPRAEGAITLLHQWDSVENLDAYRNGPLMAKIGACLRPLMTGAPATNVYEARALG